MSNDSAPSPVPIGYISRTSGDKTWSSHFLALQEQAPTVREHVAGLDTPLCVDLQLSPMALAELSSPDRTEELLHWLSSENCAVYAAGLADACDSDAIAKLIDLMANAGSPNRPATVAISPRVDGAMLYPERQDDLVNALMTGVARCAALEEKHGIQISLALEPRSLSLMETTWQAIRFIDDHIFCFEGIQILCALLGVDAPEARRLLHRHVGVCHDLCQSAAMFESPVAALAQYARAGISVCKLDVAAAPRIIDINEATLRRIERHTGLENAGPVIERRGDKRVGFDSLRGAIDATRYRLERRSTLDSRLHVPFAGNTVLAGGDAFWSPVSEALPEWRLSTPLPPTLMDAGPCTTTHSLVDQVLRCYRDDGLSIPLSVEVDPSWSRLETGHCRATQIAEELNRVTRQLSN